MRYPKLKRCLFVLCIVVGILLTNGGCSKPARRQSGYSEYKVRYAGETDIQQECIKKNCIFGVPELSRDWDFGPTELIYRKGYVLQHSGRDRIPIWVCEGFTSSQLSGPGDRENSSFKPDPDLNGPKAALGDYRGSGYDRGHMAPAADFKQNQRLMDDSHYLSNIAPQVGPRFNRGIWKKLEMEVRSWIENDDLGCEKIHVITGGFFYDPEEEDPETADGWIDYRVIGDNEVSVPTHFYKIVVGEDSDNQYRATAFVMENRKHGESTTLQEKIVSIKYVEDRTGINFMPILDEDLTLRTRLELTKGSMWSEGD